MEGAQGRHAGRAKSVSQVFEELDSTMKSGHARQLVRIPTGFQPLDRVLGGGLHAGDLTLVGGAPGVGKTIATLQWARNIAAEGRTVLYVCYEHEESELLLRLLGIEMGESAGADADQQQDRFQTALGSAAALGGSGLSAVLAQTGAPEAAAASVSAYAQNLLLVRASGSRTGLPEIEALLTETRDHPPTVLFVDYLQKVAVVPEPPDEAEKVRVVAEGLKDMALNYRIPIVSVVASDMEGIKARRLRLHHFRGSSALAYEADVAIVLNEKIRSISKVHLAYDPLRAEGFRSWVVFSVEKNRGGPNLVDLEHRKDFSHFRFDPNGGVVTERMSGDEE